MSSDTTDARRRSAPRLLARYIDPAWCQRSKGDADLKRDLEGVLGQYLEQGRIDLATMGDTLIIACRDRSSAMELRFLEREIRKILSASGQAEITKVRTMLSRERSNPMARASIPVQRSLPAAARRSLEMAAAGIDDLRLANALRRLARSVLPHA
ncbi:MAG: DciA family protein [Thioalkalivibrio sp.]|nr:DciA family protein [Thioalkalivibrio sp.]